jgi:hypothetical protein
LVSPDGAVDYTFPAGVFTATAVVTHTVLLPGQAPAATGNLAHTGQAFEIDASYHGSGGPVQPTGPFTISLTYDPQGLGAVKEPTLALYSWTGTVWQRESAAPPDTTAHTIVATPDHFSYWAVIGETERVFLPLLTLGSDGSR